MSQTIVKGINEFAAEARSVIKNVSVEEAKSMENSSEYAFVDVREKDEINKEGIIPGAFIAPRGSPKGLLFQVSRQLKYRMYIVKFILIKHLDYVHANIMKRQRQKQFMNSGHLT